MPELLRELLDPRGTPGCLARDSPTSLIHVWCQIDKAFQEDGLVQPKLRNGSGIAETPSSSPIAKDLLAAYCTENIRYVIGETESMLVASDEINPMMVPSDDDTASLRTSKAKLVAINRKLKDGLDADKNRLSRLNRYLQSRPNYPDILAAQSAAKNDIARMNALVTSGSCGECISPGLDTSETMKCMNVCSTRAMPDFPSIQNKVQSCHNLDWLLF
jgi:hypothetical protein